MTLPASGQISMSQVDVELGYSATAMISLNDAVVRALFQVPTGQISMSDGWGKSASNVGVIWNSSIYRDSLYGVAAETSASYYVAVGAAGQILQSTDGNTWVARTSGVSTQLNDVLYANGQFVVVGNSGVILTSTTGATWTARTSGVSTQLNVILYSASAGVYVAAGASNVILTSPDGVTWTARTSATPSSTIISGAYTSSTGKFVLASYVSSTSMYIQYSSNGTSWTQTATFSTTWPTDMIWTGSEYLAINTAGYNYESTDGITWTSTQVLPAKSIYSLATNGTTIMGVGTGSTSVGLFYDTVSAPTSWSDNVLAETLNAFRNSTYDGYQYWAVGLSGFIAAVDPTSFVLEQKIPSTGQTFNGAVYMGSAYCLVGSTGWTMTTYDGAAFYSTQPVATALQAVAYDGSSTLVAVGASGVVLSGTGGTIWTSQSSGITATLRGVCWTGTQFVAVAGTNIITSPDGTTWTVQTSGGSNTLYAVASSGALTVTVGASGTIRTSPDGITWTSRTSGTTSILYGVCWTGSLFVLCGAGGLIKTSPDGITWTTRTSGTTNQLSSAFWNGTFVTAAGVSGTIQTSTDGITWTTRTSGTTNNLVTVAGTTTKLLAAGASGTVLTST